MARRTAAIIYLGVPVLGAGLVALLFEYHVPSGFFALLALWTGLLVGVPFLSSTD